MYFLIYGGLAAALIFSGLTLGGVRSTSFKVVLTIFAFFTTGLFGWLAMPVMAWNFAGNWGILVVLGVVIVVATLSYHDSVSSNRHRFDDEADNRKPRRSLLIWVPLALGLFMLIPVAMITTWSMFHASDYRELLGEPTVSDFTSDVSPVDINQVRRVDQELAKMLGSKLIEEQPGLGSRVQLGTMNIQTVNGCFGIRDGRGREDSLCFDNELLWVGPLFHDGFWKWFTNETTPGYVLVSATNPNRVYQVTALRTLAEQPEPSTSTRMGVETETTAFSDIQLRYLVVGAYFGDYLVRHLRTNGYVTAGLTDFSFEIDNTGRPHWVVTQFERKVGFSGADAIGVVVVDAQTGAISHFAVADAPEWIDRIQPEDMVLSQINTWGEFIDGYWNTWFGRNDIVSATPGMSLVYGSDGQSYWYSGIQSGGADTGTNSFVLVNTRTKEVRRYMINGANEVAARGSAENAPGVREARYVGTNPILYNVSGEPTYFLTLKSGDGLVKMVGFVNLRNYETVGVGASVQQALRNYQNALISQGRGNTIQDLTTQQRVEAVVADFVQIDETIYLLLEGQPNTEYYGTTDISPELKWARPGLPVVVIVENGGAKSLQIYAFDIPSLGISDLPDDGS